MNLAFFVRVTSEPDGNQSYRSYSHVSLNYEIKLKFCKTFGKIFPIRVTSMRIEIYKKKSPKLYNKTCLKGPLKKNTKNWFSRLIIA